MIRKVKTIIEEQETYIYLSPLESDGNALVYTTEPAMIKKMWELHKKQPDVVKIKRDDKYGTDFLIPPTWIDIKPKKQLTDAQKKELVERFNKGRNKKAKQNAR